MTDGLTCKTCGHYHLMEMITSGPYSYLGDIPCLRCCRFGRENDEHTALWMKGEAMYELTEDDKRSLTEFLGECWHEKSGKSYFPIGIKGIPRGPESYLCAKCNTKFYDNQFRTFTTWEDLGALQEKLVEAERWWEFEQQFCLIKWDWVEQGKYQSFLDWIFTPTRFCWLVSEFLKEEQG